MGQNPQSQILDSPLGVLAQRPRGQRPLGRPRHRWEDNIKVDLREVGMVLETVHILLNIESIEGLCKDSNESPGFLKA